MRSKDLSAYKITNPMPKLELDEVAISDGDLCGSVFLDKEFLEFVEEKLETRLSENIRYDVRFFYNFLMTYLILLGSGTILGERKWYLAIRNVSKRCIDKIRLHWR